VIQSPTVTPPVKHDLANQVSKWTCAELEKRDAQPRTSSMGGGMEGGAAGRERAHSARLRPAALVGKPPGGRGARPPRRGTIPAPRRGPGFLSTTLQGNAFEYWGRSRSTHRSGRE
jgi:hypothetical protein